MTIRQGRALPNVLRPLALGGIATLALIGACRGGGVLNPVPPGKSGALTTQLSDPAPCLDRYEHIWITVRDVRASLAASTNSSESAAADLTPTLSNNPRQVDLLGPLTCCFPAALGSVSGIAPGTYQGITLFLLDNAPPESGVIPPSPNQCKSAGAPDNVFNCAVDAKGVVKPLKLADAAKGIKVPQPQIACGGLTVAADQDADIDLYFNACASVADGADPKSAVFKPTIWGRARPRAAATK